SSQVRRALPSSVSLCLCASVVKTPPKQNGKPKPAVEPDRNPDLLHAERLHPRRQTRLIPRCRILVQHTLLNSLIECGDCRAIRCVGRCLVTLGDCLPHCAQGATHL